MIDSKYFHSQTSSKLQRRGIILNSVVRGPDIIVLIFWLNELPHYLLLFLINQWSKRRRCVLCSRQFLHLLCKPFSSVNPAIMRGQWSKRGVVISWLLIRIVDTIHKILAVGFYLLLKVFEFNETLRIFWIDRNVGKDIEIIFQSAFQKIPFASMIVPE